MQTAIVTSSLTGVPAAGIHLAKKSGRARPIQTFKKLVINPLNEIEVANPSKDTCSKWRPSVCSFVNDVKVIIADGTTIAKN